MNNATQKRNHRRAAFTSVRLELVTMLVLATAVILGTAATGHDPRSTASGDGDAAFGQGVADDLEDVIDAIIDDAPTTTAYVGVDELELDVKFFIEFNETDEDVGVQAKIGGEPYRRLRVINPENKRILDIRARRALKDQGLSELFFESAEPTLDELSIGAFLERFPEGTYEFESRTIENLEQDGEASFTHAIPAGPVISSPADGDVVPTAGLMITWEAVTMTTAFAPPQVPVTIVGYQVIVTREDPLRVYSMDVSADTTSVSVPPEFLEPGTEYELEIIAIEESDNQTISLLFFETEE